MKDSPCTWETIIKRYLLSTLRKAEYTGLIPSGARNHSFRGFDVKGLEVKTYLDTLPPVDFTLTHS